MSKKQEQAETTTKAENAGNEVVGKVGVVEPRLVCYKAVLIEWLELRNLGLVVVELGV